MWRWRSGWLFFLTLPGKHVDTTVTRDLTYSHVTVQPTFKTTKIAIGLKQKKMCLKKDYSPLMCVMNGSRQAKNGKHVGKNGRSWVDRKNCVKLWQSNVKIILKHAICFQSAFECVLVVISVTATARWFPVNLYSSVRLHPFSQGFSYKKFNYPNKFWNTLQLNRFAS